MYLYKRNRFAYNGTTLLFRESYADYVGWLLGHSYYSAKVGMDSNDWDNHFYCDNQRWQKTWTSNYSPFFVDLVDDHNQKNINVNYNNDLIAEIPHSLIKTLVINNKTWTDFKNTLSNYIGLYFSQSDYNAFIEPYDYFFQHHLSSN